MAVYIKAKTQDMVEVAPAKGNAFRLEELQKFVGGYIEAVYLRDGRVMWLNEEGKLDGLPYNAIATDMARRLSGLHEGNLPIVGDVVIATREESGEGDDEDEQ